MLYSKVNIYFKTIKQPIVHINDKLRDFFKPKESNNLIITNNKVAWYTKQP